MVDKIVTDFILDFKDGNSRERVQQLAKELNSAVKSAQQNFEKLRIDPSVLNTVRELKLALAAPQFKEFQNLTEAAATKRGIKGSDAAVSADVYRAVLATLKTIASTQATMIKQDQVRTRLKKGIVDLDTLEVQRQDALLKRAIPYQTFITAKGKERTAAAQELKAIEQEITNIERQRQNLVAQQQKEREQKVAAAKAEAAAAKEAERAERARAKAAAAEAAKAAAAEAKASTPQALRSAGRDAFREAENLRKIKAGIVDLDTLAYQKQQALLQVGQSLRNQARVYGAARDAVNQKLERQYALLRDIEVKEKKVNQSSRLKDITQTGGLDLLRIQAQLIVNYGLINAALNSIRFSAQFVSDLDDAFHRLQAIAGLTDTQMTGLKDTILEVAGKSKFSAKEIADSAVVLAQAGFSGGQIKEVLKAVNDLATASGSTLANAIQNVTSVLNVFNYGADQTAQVANLMTSALNLSKLSMDQITLGIQYAANSAAEAQIPFSEMIATFSVLADAGIKSGSTIGTGYRKLLQDLLAPTEKFQRRAAQLGLTMDDLDVKTKGLGGVLNTLREAGFTAADAMGTLDLRAAAVAVPLLRSTDAIAKFQQQMYLTESVVSGSAKQMESLQSSTVKLQNTFGALVYDISEGFVGVLAKITGGFADLIQSSKGFATILKGIVFEFGLLFAGAISVQIYKMISNMTGLGKAATFALNGVSKLIFGMELLKVTTKKTTWAVRGLDLAWRSTIVGLAITAVVTGITYALGKLVSIQMDHTEALEDAKTAAQNAAAETDKYRQRTVQLNNFLKTLTDQYDELSENSEVLRAKTLEAAAAFNKMGGQAILSGDKIDILRKKIQALSKESYQQAIQAADIQQVKEGLLIAEQRDNLFKQSKDDKETIRDIRGSSDVRNQQILGPKFDQLFTNFNQFLNDPNRNSDSLKVLQGEITTAIKNLKPDTPRAEKQLDLLRQLLDVSNKYEAGLSQIDLSKQTIDQLKEFKGQATVDANLSGRISNDILGFSRVVKDVKENFQKSGDLNSGKIALARLDNVIDQIKVRIANTEARDGGKNSDTLTALETELARVQGERLKIAEYQYLREKDSAEAAAELRGLQIKQYEAVARDADLNEASAATQKIIALNKEKYNTAILEAKAFVNSEKFIDEQFIALNKQVPKSKSPEFKAAQQRYFNLKQLAAQQELDNAINAAKQNLKNRRSNQDARLDRPVTSEAQTIANEIKAASTQYKSAVDALQANTQLAQANRASLDSPKNAPFVSEGRRYRADQELRTLEEKNLRSQYALAKDWSDFLAQQRSALEALLGVTLQAAEKQKDAGIDFAGTPTGKQAAKARGLDATEINKIHELLLKVGEEQRKNIDSQQTLTAETAKYGDVQQKNASIGSVFTDSLQKFYDEGYYNAQATSQDFIGLFQQIRSGFEEVVIGFTSGTKDIGSAFKDLGVSILQTLQRIAVSKFTESFLNLLIPLGLSALGTPSTSNPDLALANSSYNIKATGYARGGFIRGGTPGRDSVPIMGMPGEAVLNTKAVKLLGADTITKLNNGNLDLKQASNTFVQTDGGKQDKVVNVYVVSPDQTPPLGPNDIVAVVGQNIATGGSLKNLIKSVTI